MRVAVLANRKYSVKMLDGAPEDALAEYDAEETVEAIQEALNSGRTRRGAYKDRLAEVEKEIANLKKLEQEHKHLI